REKAGRQRFVLAQILHTVCPDSLHESHNRGTATHCCEVYLCHSRGSRRNAPHPTSVAPIARHSAAKRAGGRPSARRPTDGDRQQSSRSPPLMAAGRADRTRGGELKFGGRPLERAIV